MVQGYPQEVVSLNWAAHSNGCWFSNARSHDQFENCNLEKSSICTYIQESLTANVRSLDAKQFAMYDALQLPYSHSLMQKLCDINFRVPINISSNACTFRKFLRHQVKYHPQSPGHVTDMWMWLIRISMSYHFLFYEEPGLGGLGGASLGGPLEWLLGGRGGVTGPGLQEESEAILSEAQLVLPRHSSQQLKTLCTYGSTGQCWAL